MIFICNILLFLVENWLRKWAIFLSFITSWFLKISQHVSQISLWLIFKNQKSEIYNCFVFSCWSSWDDFDLPYLTVSGWKMATTMGNFLIFRNLMIFENLSTCFANISVMNFQKSKIWDVHFLRFFMLIVMRWFWYAIFYLSWRENGLENDQFSSISILYFFLLEKFNVLLNNIFEFQTMLFGYVERFSKIMKLWKIRKRPIF